MGGDVKDLLAATCLDPQGQVHRIGDICALQPTVLVFVRHFGCIFCRERISELKSVLPEIETLGAKAVVIGCGTALMAEDFVESFGVDVPVYTDPSREVFLLLQRPLPGHPRDLSRSTSPHEEV